VIKCYSKTLRWVLDHQTATLVVTGATLAATILLFVIIPKGFFPQQDVGRLAGAIQADQGTSFQTMRTRLGQIVEIVQADPVVASVVGFTGG
jgi:multidrug efflux pump